MKIKDEETKEQRAYRTGIALEEGRNRLPLLILFAVITLITALLIGYTEQLNTSKYGVGNPYNCEGCRNLGKACSKHHNYDREQNLYNKVYKFVDRVGTDEITEQHSKYVMYDWGNEYNTECDFCNKEKSECYSCKYDRLYIQDAYERITNTEEFKSLLCNDCKQSGHANNEICKEMLTKLILSDIKNGGENE